MKNTKAKKIVLSGIMMSLVMVSTMMIQIPMIATKGYINLGDSIIYLSGFFFGPTVGFFAGGIGSALADIFSGYSYWAPFTLVIKGIMGLVIGLLAGKLRIDNILGRFSIFLAIICGSIMVGGYFISGWIMYGDMYVSLASVPGNIVQGFAGIIIYLAVGKSLQKAGLSPSNWSNSTLEYSK